MTQERPTYTANFDNLAVRVYKDQTSLAEAAGSAVADILKNAVHQKGAAAVVFATGNSQLTFLNTLGKKVNKEVWAQVTAFHLDEYVGISSSHKSSFRHWIKDKVEKQFSPKTVNYIQGDADDLQAECKRYEACLKPYLDEGLLDLCCLGVGENGHLAFNEPHITDFSDPSLVKVVELSLASRNQQVNEGHFPSIKEVPKLAITLTIPAILAAQAVVALASESRKAKVVRDMLFGEVSNGCPGSVLRTHHNATLYLDAESAFLL